MIDIVDQMANAILNVKKSMNEYQNSIKNKNNPDFDIDQCYFHYLKYNQAKINYERIEPLFNEFANIHREGVQIRDDEEYGVC